MTTMIIEYIVLPENATRGTVYSWYDVISGETRQSRLDGGYRDIHGQLMAQLTDTKTGELYERVVLEPVNEVTK